MKSSVCWSSLSIIYVLAHFQQVVGILTLPYISCSPMKLTVYKILIKENTNKTENIFKEKKQKKTP